MTFHYIIGNVRKLGVHLPSNVRLDFHVPILPPIHAIDKVTYRVDTEDCIGKLTKALAILQWCQKTGIPSLAVNDESVATVLKGLTGHSVNIQYTDVSFDTPSDLPAWWTGPNYIM